MYNTSTDAHLNTLISPDAKKDSSRDRWHIQRPLPVRTNDDCSTPLNGLVFCSREKGCGERALTPSSGRT